MHAGFSDSSSVCTPQIRAAGEPNHRRRCGCSSPISRLGRHFRLLSSHENKLSLKAFLLRRLKSRHSVEKPQIQFRDHHAPPSNCGKHTNVASPWTSRCIALSVPPAAACDPSGHICQLRARSGSSSSSCCCRCRDFAAAAPAAAAAAAPSVQQRELGRVPLLYGH